ncbi:MAG: hypothetical protein Q4D13_06940 [Erysipelotrichaceae bacterium]|nr:hypothetical protein [Erysipelotrichaceae bacterium]
MNSTNTFNTGKDISLISEENRNSLDENEYLYSVPGLAESIIKASKEDPETMEVYNPDKEW